MKKQHKRIIAKYLLSYLLLLCISVTVFPFNILHHHKEDIHCDVSNERLENDPCHISIYHPNESQKPCCDHKAHVDKEITICEFCKFLTSHWHIYTANKHYSLIPALHVEASIAFENPFFPNTFSKAIFSRGPPA